MLFGERPYGHGLSQQRILNDGTILDAKAVQFPTSPLVSEDCKNFIRRCLTYEQSMRPSIAELCQDAYVRGRK
jgi:tousled-like kinase